MQIGNGRAGFYSYDWIDNAGRPSTREIIPEYQHVEVGDLVPMLPGTEVGMWVKGFEANRWMLWWDKKGEATWAWELYPQGEGRTRMISRLHVRYAWTSPMIIYYLIQDVGDIVMLRKRMLGIKERAERGTATRTANRAQGRSEQVGNKLCVGLVGAVAGGYLLRRQVLAVVLIVVVAAGIAVLSQR